MHVELSRGRHFGRTEYTLLSHSFFISLSSAAYILNIVKYRSKYFTGDPSTYTNMENDISKGEKIKRTTSKDIYSSYYSKYIYSQTC